ncbi:LacI family transcriptional regulator [Paramesorhizobium deserti]|uniref:LacI family transcriptional regulator n=1 Tax=Paramesorhizobium deserti TaxID=1494590 RepID=A0A135HTS0_9HYPH|nr:substrate-binding domain-containing protein [Paramesorhizobium deserti]KXF76591.1 LacI family transcriptional regulator [Paramesorhizobium deserti]
MSIRDLARHLDISIGTVSRALNGKADVNPETRERVLEAAKRLGYVPNQSGRSLRQGTTNTIGFMIESTIETADAGGSFFMPVFEGVQSVFRRHHLDLVALLCGTDEDPASYLNRVVGRRFVDGLIISATMRHDPRIDFLLERKIPFVALGRSATRGDYSWIDLDFEGVAATAVTRLAGFGHRRIAIGTPASDLNLGYVFLDGYKRALAANGIGFDPSLILPANGNEEGGYQVACRLLAQEPMPTAIILVNENMAVGLYRRLYEAGLQPGRDIAVIGFRESTQSRFLSPTLTCFRISLRDLGIKLAEAMLSALPAFEGQYPRETVELIWPMQLVSGESDRPGSPSGLA